MDYVSYMDHVLYQYSKQRQRDFNRLLAAIREHYKGARMATKPRILKSKDGPGNFVFKTSDTKKNSKGQFVAIAVLSTRFKKPHRFKSVILYKGRIVNGEVEIEKVVSKLKWVYYLDEDGTMRQVWRTELAMKDLPKGCLLRAVGPNGREFIWPMTDAQRRND